MNRSLKRAVWIVALLLLGFHYTYSRNRDNTGNLINKSNNASVIIKRNNEKKMLENLKKTKNLTQKETDAFYKNAAVIEFNQEFLTDRYQAQRINGALRVSNPDSTSNFFIDPQYGIISNNVWLDPSNGWNSISSTYGGSFIQLGAEGSISFRRLGGAYSAPYLASFSAATGFFGLGTGVGLAPFHLAGENNMIIDPRLFAFGNNVGYNGDYKYNIDTSRGSSYMQLSTDGIVTFMKIPHGSTTPAVIASFGGTSNNNMGIGTDAPQAGLHIAGASNMVIEPAVAGIGNNIKWTGSAFNNIDQYSGSSFMQFSKYGGFLFRKTPSGSGTVTASYVAGIDGAGNMAIGSDSVRYANTRLYVTGGAIRGDIPGYGPSLALIGGNSNLIVGHDATYDVSLYNTSGGFHFRGPNGTTNWLSINTSGNVGIGTEQTGTYRLAVGGNIHAYKLVVETGWADYVFAKDYKLRSLESLESYINKNKHLPEVPTSRQVAEDGVSVGDSISLLLKKIEELSLYVIAQQKQIDLQTKEIKKMKKTASNNIN